MGTRKSLIAIIAMTITLAILNLSLVYANNEDMSKYKWGLGIVFQPVSPYIFPVQAIEVISIFGNSPAYQSLFLGDVITHINEKRIADYNFNELSEVFGGEESLVLKLVRNNKNLKVVITPGYFDITPENITESRFMPSKIKSFLSESVMSDLSSAHGVRNGDCFFIMENHNVLGVARAREINSYRTILTIVNRKGKIHEHRPQNYSLVYAGYYPVTGPRHSREALQAIQRAKYEAWKAAVEIEKARAASPKYYHYNKQTIIQQQ